MSTTRPEDGQSARLAALGGGAGLGTSPVAGGAVDRSPGCSFSAWTRPGVCETLGVGAGSPSPAGTNNPAHPDSDRVNAPAMHTAATALRVLFPVLAVSCMLMHPPPYRPAA